MKYNLDDLYLGYDDPNYINDLEQLDTLVKPINLEINNLDNLKKVINVIEDYTILIKKLHSFAYLSKAIDTTNPIHSKNLEIILKKESENTKFFTLLKQYIANYPNLLAEIKNDSYLINYQFYFEEVLEKNKYSLNEDIEKTISEMELSGSVAWRNLQQYLTSTVTSKFNGKQTTLSEIRNFAYNSNPTLRKEAFYNELAMYDKIKDSVAFALNNIKSTVITNCKLRNIESPIQLTLEQSRMKKETLDSLISSIEDFLPVFRKYLKHKAKLLGYNNGLPFYDLFATFETKSKKYSIAESKEFLIKHFSTFSDDLVELVNNAYDKNWIDFEPRVGKLGGAFCSNLGMIKQSRILTNYDGSLSDIVTLAHELGHAYHGLHIENHLPLNRNYTMPVAETASIFNENIILNASLKEANDEEKIFLIESQLQDATQIIVDIYSRYLFEKEVFEKRKDQFLFADDLANIMKNAQLKAYGDGLDKNTLHPYMWICKPHYYYTNLNFYNFPYAFGGLFAKGLYSIYEKNSNGFVDKYQNLLKNTTILKVEDVAKIMDIDLTKKAFWTESLKAFEKQINLFIELTTKK